MYSSKYKLAKKIAVPVIIFFFIFQLALPSLLTNDPIIAIAFAPDTEAGETAGLSRDVAEQVQKTTKETTDEVKETVLDRIFKGLMLSASITLRNALVYMSQKMAEQTVDWMATGEWGQGAMFYEQAWGKFTDDIVNQTMGVFLDNLRNEVWSETGFDICDPSLPSDKIVIMLGIEEPNLPDDPGMLEHKEVDCTLSKFTDNWEAFGENIESKYNEFIEDPGAMSLAYLQESATLAFDPKYSEVGVMLKLESELKKEQADKAAAEEKQRAEGDGQKAKTSMAGEHVQAPAYAGKKKVEKEIEDVKDMPKSEMDSSKEVITEIPESMVAAFLNSFVSQAFSELIMKKMFEQGLTKTSESYKPKQYVFESGDQLKEEIQQATKVSKVNYSHSTAEIDLLTQFTNCPQDRQMYNCVVDHDFAQVVRAATQDKSMNLREAIESGKVDGGLPLIPRIDDRNSSDSCYLEGWCYSNLVKLRMARIIPIGWELAADLIEEGETYTLEQVMNKFNTQGDKFEHLIDPNWVFQYPKTKCNAQVSGPTLIGNGASEREEVCADIQSCLREDETGKCKAWGYCAAEKNIFKFGGQGCDGQYSSCKVLTSREGEEVQYLLNTVDKTGCDPNSVGCKWYSLAMDGSPLKWQDDSSKKIFLNKSIDDFECQPGAEGCTRFVKTAAGMGTNLIANGGFEIFEGEVDDILNNGNTVNGWTTDLQMQNKSLDVISDSVSGAAALSLSSESVYSRPLVIVPKSFTRYFAVSLQAQKTAESGAIDVDLVNVNNDLGLTVVNVVDVDNGVKHLDGEAVNSWASVYEIWKVTSENGAAGGGDQHLKITVTGNVNIDNVLFEEIDSPSIGSIHQYTEYASKNAEYVKQAPEYLQCYNVNSTTSSSVLVTTEESTSTPLSSGSVACGNIGKSCNEMEVSCHNKGGSESWSTSSASCDDEEFSSSCVYRAQCSSSPASYGQPLVEADIKKDDDVAKTAVVRGCEDFAELCTAEEVGCKEYSVTDGSRVVNGVASFNDYCPQQCNGYGTFNQSSTYFADDLFPAYLIPSTATQCTAAAAGCEEFTNLDEVAEGAEAKEYFSELRMCEQLPEKKDSCANFYTWVAEEVTGYQLKTYYLKKDSNGLPEVVGGEDPTTCNKEIFDAQVNPDCRAFYNDAGQVSYRLYSQTITCSTDCHPYRRTLEYLDIPGGLTGQEQCENRQGEWQNGECIFLSIPSEGKTCNAVDAGCKEYKGNYSGDEEIVFQSFFNQSDLEKFTDNGTIVTLAEGAVYDSNIVKLTEENTSFATGNYLMSFWVRKKSAADTVIIEVTVNDESKGNINLGATDEWSFYTYNFNVSSDQAYTNYTIELSDSTAFYTDNFQIKKVSDSNYLIQDSWNTPEVCDYSLLNDVTPLPQAQVGCREYQDEVGTIHYLKTFSGLCSADKVGCEALIDTKNNLNPFEEEFEQIVDPELLCSEWPNMFQSLLASTPSNYPQYAGAKMTGFSRIDGTSCIAEIEKADGSVEELEPVASLEGICVIMDQPSMGGVAGQEYYWDNANSKCKVKVATISADNTIYLVNTEKDQCQKSEKGCMAVGLPAFKAGVVDPESWETYFYRLDPELFGSLNSPLCQSSAQSCEEYKDDKGSTYFFKNPLGNVCEWTQGVVGTETKEAWFIKGEDPIEANLCGGSESYAVDYYGDGVDHLRSSDTPGYSGWVGECPEREDQCNAFIDPVDDIDNDGVGKAYYYIDNEQIDRSCTGVNLKAGCVLFNNTSNSQLKYNAAETYSQAVGNNLVGAVTTGVVDSNEIIKVNRGRECASWYDCKSSHWAWDPNQNRYVEVCDKVGVCSSLTTATSEPKCAKFINTSQGNTNLLTINQPLQQDYANRPIDWENFEYSGLAIPYSAPLHFYNAYDISEDEKVTDYRLVNFDSYEGDRCENDAACEEFCEESGAALDPLSDDFTAKCRCLNGKCVRPNPTAIGQFSDSPMPACRAYPDRESPFPYSTRSAQAFANANRMYYGNKVGSTVEPLKGGDLGIKPNEDYACSYSKLLFGGGTITKYFPTKFIAEAQEIDGFCQDDENITCSCSTLEAGTLTDKNDVIIRTEKTCSSLACGESTNRYGICMRKSVEDDVVENYQGWQGYCLERDRSMTINNNPNENPCLLWYPSDSLGGLQDIKNNYEEAGYNPSLATGSLFTTNVAGWNKEWKLGDFDNDVYDAPYIRNVTNIGKSLPSWTFWMKTGSHSWDSYLEWYQPAGGWDTIYLEDIQGILVECADAHSDWCGPKAKRYTAETNGTGFYEISDNVFNRPDDLPPYFYIPMEGVSSGPNVQDGALSTYNAHVKTRTFGQDGYEYHGATSEQVDNFNGYRYYQLVWDEGAHTTIPNEWVWGGADSDGGYKILGKNSGSTLSGKSPLFMGVGWNHSKKKCVNLITGNEIDAALCDGDTSGSDLSDSSAFKTNPSCQSSNTCDDWIKVSCSSDADCGNEDIVGEDNAGSWTSTGNWSTDTYGKCMSIGGESVCSNQQCMGIEDDGQNVSCKNSGGNPVWTCSSEIDELGFCQNALDTEIGSVNDNYQTNIVGHCDSKADNSDGGHRNNYWGLRVVFDENGRYTGVWQSICDESSKIGWQDLRISFVFKEYSNEILQVNKVGNTGNVNMAYTDKIYQKAKNNSVIKNTSGSDGRVRWDSITAPMGSASGNTVSLGSQLLIPAVATNDEEEKPILQPGGSPWLGGSVDSHGGKTYGCDGASETQYCTGDKDEFNSGTDTAQTLSNYFARIYQRWIWDRPGAIYGQMIGDTDYLGEFAFESDKSSEEQGIPIIAAVVPTGQTDSQGNQLYGAVPGKITLNGKQEGNQEAQDGDFEAVIKFYTWTHDDQMPLKRLKVNWGDGSEDVTLSGKFKNHKPRCQREESELLGVCRSDVSYENANDYFPNEIGEIYGYACNEDYECSHLSDGSCTDTKQDRFGDVNSRTLSGYNGIVSACEEAYFQFNNQYICEGPGSVNDVECSVASDTNCWDASYKDGEGACRYRVGVQIQDNWLRCNDDTSWNGNVANMSNGEFDNKCGQDEYEYYDDYIYVMP